MRTYRAWGTPMSARSKASPPATVGSSGQMPLSGFDSTGCQPPQPVQGYASFWQEK